MQEELDAAWLDTWELKVDEKVTTYLRENHALYGELEGKQKELGKKYSAIRKFFDRNTGISLSGEEHKAIIEYIQTAGNTERIEREYCFYFGQSLAFSYGQMLSRLKEELCRPEPKSTEVKNQMLDLMTEGRVEEAEKELKRTSEGYRACLEELAEKEKIVEEINLSREDMKLLEAYMEVANYRWILCSEYLYRCGMEDMLRLLREK